MANTTLQRIFAPISRAIVKANVITAVAGSSITHTETGGTFVATGATPVVVGELAVNANSAIIITLKTVGGTVSPSTPYIATITPGTGFTVTGTAGDTSTYNYLVIG